jgi:hypothetical protein
MNQPLRGVTYPPPHPLGLSTCSSLKTPCPQQYAQPDHPEASVQQPLPQAHHPWPDHLPTAANTSSRSPTPTTSSKTSPARTPPVIQLSR